MRNSWLEFMEGTVTHMLQLIQISHGRLQTAFGAAAFEKLLVYDAP